MIGDVASLQLVPKLTSTDQLSKVQLKFLEKKSTKHMFSESDNLYNLKSKSLRLIVVMNVYLTNLAARKHGSEADFLIMTRVNILCWNGAGSYA